MYPVFVRQLFCITRVATQSDVDTIWYFAVSHCPQKFANLANSYSPFFPLLALNYKFVRSRFNNQVNSAIRIRTSETLHGTTILTVNQLNEFLELEPVNPTKLFRYCEFFDGKLRNMFFSIRCL